MFAHATTMFGGSDAARTQLSAVLAATGVLLTIAAAGTVTPMMSGVSPVTAPICAVSDPNASQGDTVVPVASYPLPNVLGKRVTVVSVIYAPGGFSRPHRHAGSVTAYIVKGEIRSQLAGGPVQVYKPGETFFEPPGSVHQVSANASQTEPAELIAVFVADEGAQLTTYLD
jgi:quercetin dioxygenase-like cupin family protein